MSRLREISVGLVIQYFKADESKCSITDKFSIKQTHIPFLIRFISYFVYQSLFCYSAPRLVIGQSPVATENKRAADNTLSALRAQEAIRLAL